MKAVDINQLPKVQEQSSYNLVIIDGTWAQAKTMFNKSISLQSLKQVIVDNLRSFCSLSELSLGKITFFQVKLSDHRGSEYIIRTQPTETCLSTVETAAEALSVLESRPDFKSDLLRPLSALCLYQLNHGAVIHESKEFRLKNQTYPKLIGKRLKKLLEKTYSESEKEDLNKTVHLLNENCKKNANDDQTS